MKDRAAPDGAAAGNHPSKSRWERFDAFGLRPQLGILVCATALPLLALALLMVNQLVDLERQSTRTSLMNSARTLAALTDNEIDTYSAIATALAQSLALRNGDLATFWAQSKKALELVPGAWLELRDASDRPLLNTLQPSPAATPPRNGGVDLQAISTGKPQVSDIVMDPTSGRHTAFVRVPVFEHGVASYSIAVSLIPERFLQLIENKFTQEELLGILDRRGNFVARIPDHAERVGTPASEGWRRAIASTPLGWTENRTLEGELAITAYAPTANGWTVGISYRQAALDAPLRNVLWTIGLIGTALVLLSLGLAWALGRRFASSMESLTALAGDVGDKVVDAPRLSFREATMIGRALSQVSRKLNAQSAALTQFNAELENKVALRTSELVAEMKRREDSEAKVRQMQRIESLGQLTGGIAHDFNNMLAIVLGCLDMLQRRLERGDAKVGEFIEGARQGAQRAVTLTQRLLAFSRRQALHPQPVDANKLIANMSDLLHRTIPESIRVETVFAGGLWRINVDVGELENALINLASNARDAMPDGGKLTIETANAHLDDAYASTQADVAPGQYVLIAVTDNGPGMRPEVVAKAFEPFFTTKPPGRGTGLGLSQVYGFIKQSGGHVRIYSEPGQGVSVKLYLPRFYGPAEVTAPEPQAPAHLPLSQVNELVLVVEDDPAVLKLTVGMLSELGYRTLAAESAAKALELLDANADVRLLLTDIVMPDMNGRRLAEAAVKRRPGLAVLFATGYTRNAVVHNGTIDPDVELIMKPFSLDALAQKVARVLRGGKAAAL
jgi:signal transduction histidine kinase/CheY-like chemotaxis protein